MYIIVFFSSAGCGFYHELLYARVFGTVDIGVKTIHECIDACVRAYPKCIAVDWVFEDSKCYLQDANVTNNPTWNTCCMRYELQCLSKSPASC